MRPHGIMFHHLWDDHHPRAQGAVSANDLRRLLEFLGPEKILPAHEWLRRAIGGNLRPWDVCLTFDDTLRCQYDVAVPVLRHYGLTAFFFVYTSVLRGNPERLEIYRHFRTTAFANVDDFYAAFFRAVGASAHAVDVVRQLDGFDAGTYLAGFPFYTRADRTFRYVRDEVLGPAKYFAVMDRMMADARVDIGQVAAGLWMTEDHVRELHGEGHVIGLHSDTHPTRLGEISPAGQEREYQTNFDELTRICGEPPVAMSHPCNSYNPHTLRILRKLGIKLGFRANMAEGRFGELEWPREDHANLMQRMGGIAA